MADTGPVESPLAAASGAAGPHAPEAFALLGNETRLSILLALWEEYDPKATDNGVPFSRIFERIDHDDRGNVSYHLSKLTGQFVQQQTDRGGYELRETGLKLVRAVIAGAGVQDVELERTEIDQACPFCDAPTTVSYHDGVVLHTCTDCDGTGPAQTDTEGFLDAVPFDPAGLAERTPEEIRAASTVAALRQVQSLFEGLCLACSGPVEGWLECCSNHDSTGICDHCGTTFAVWAHFRCRVCKNHSTTSPKSLALFHPAVIAFYEDHDVSTRIRADDYESVRRVFDLMDDHVMDPVSQDPPLVAVRTVQDGDDVCLTFDEAATVVDVRR
ncbi:winged helix-turn-helix domain-containing protein [Haloarchaeobius sp. DFWS5]|uniref:winged helix-turn-helix domain-containing protein n=1 Tax=Haloarchaeobius sp. DFWS5 TaxID=3446114 RepID=UPI003EBF4AB6